MIPPAPNHSLRLNLAIAITLFGLGGIGVVVMHYFHPQNFQALLQLSPAALFKSIGLGTLYAALTLPVLILLLRAAWMENTRQFFARLMVEYRVGHIHIWLLSICAGIGEELLFRGGIQPFLGIWPTAVIFVLMHGYLNPLNRPLFIYGMLLTLVSAGFGYLDVMFGLPSAMAAHAWIDVGLLYYLRTQRVTIT